jgi:ferritin
MLSKKMEKALNDQINAELFSAYLYLSIAAYFESGNLSGFAHWMTRQASEEQGHAKRIFDYVHERGGRVLLKAIEAPETSWKSPLAAFKAALEHE